MFKLLNSKRGIGVIETIILTYVLSVATMCGASYLKSHQKNKTVDTIENPATPEWAREVK